MLGIIIGVGAVLILVSVVQGYNADLTAYYEKQGVNKVNVTLRNYDRTNSTDQSGEFMDWVNQALAEQITGSLVSEQQNNISIDAVQSTVCDYFNITHEQMVSPCRKRQIVQTRQIAMYLSRALIPNCSLSTIGSEIGGKDHATVLHACNQVSDLMSTDKTFRQYVNDIHKMLVPVDR